MRAVIGHRFGGIDDLVHEEIAPPALEPGTVRIAVRAAGVSFANLLFIAGKHQNRPSVPLSPVPRSAVWSATSHRTFAPR